MCIACDLKNGIKLHALSSRRTFLKTAAAAGAFYAGATIPGAVGALAKENEKASIIIENAKIITLDPKNPSAEAIAIRGEEILAVGRRRDIEKFKSPETQLIDAGGRTIIPGLNDSHTHFIRGGLTYSQELRWDGVPSLALALKMLKEQAVRTPAAHWVQVVEAGNNGSAARVDQLCFR